MSGQRVPVIDLFAGPGGLSEGFSAFSRRGSHFDVRLSIEKDAAAHRTLLLRSFVRQFPRGELPEAYYRYVTGEVPDVAVLFDQFPEQAISAARQAWLAELGKIPFRTLAGRVSEALGDAGQWVLLGGPPCQAYSVIGRARMQGVGDFASDHRHTLYREYVRIVAAFAPTVFVMENVKGILSSRLDGEPIFAKILRDMREPWKALSPRDKRALRSRSGRKPTYRIWSFVVPAKWEEQLSFNDYVIEAERFGLPQTRHRVILLGIRSDFDVPPEPLESAAAPPTVREVIGSLPRIRSRLSTHDSAGNWLSAVRQVLRSGYLCEIRDPGLRADLRRNVESLDAELSPGERFVSCPSGVSALRRWLADPRLGGVLQHEARSHMATDLHRYIYASSFSQRYKRSPKLDEFPSGLLPDHANAVADKHGFIRKFSDRFRVQGWDDPASTVTAHISKDGHYFIHPDPLQCRALTVREAARLQTFPDNYFFEGNRTQCYAQVGNAVPPFLAYQLAGTVADTLERCTDHSLKDLDSAPESA